MANLKIKNAPLIPDDQLENSIKLPTGGKGNYAVSLGQIANYTKNSLSLAVQSSINELRNTKADKANTYTKEEVDAKDTSLQSQIDQKATAEYLDNALTEQTNTVNTALSNLSTVASKFYPTLAEANADIANISVNQIVNIGEVANGGLWYKDTAEATTLTKSAYDPLTQAKSYANSFFTQYDYSTLLTIQNSFIDKTKNGVVSSSSSLDCSDFIPVVGGESYDIYSCVTGNASHAWYDENKAFIGAFGEDQTTLSLKTYIAPTNARYIRVSAYTTARTSAYLNSKLYVIDKIKKIIQQHTPQMDASKIDYSSSNVKATLDTVISKQNTIIANQNGIVGQLDLITDKESPYFVNTAQFVKAVLTPTNFGVVNVTARVSDTQMTVSDTTAFIYSGSCVVYDPTADSYTSHNVIGINGTTITVMPPLPANPTQAQTMHDSYQGQHLTLFGTKGLADYILKSIQKYSYKKSENLIFNFNPTKFERQTPNLGQITTDGTTVAIPVTLLGTAKTGGLVAGTTNLFKWCDMNSGNLNIGNSAHTQYLSRSYQLQDSLAGNGFEISFDGQGSDGFIEIPLAVRDESYISSADSQTYRTSGQARLQVFNGATSIHDAVYAAGQVHHVFVDFTAAETIKVRVTCETSTPTSVLLSGIFAYKKSAKTSKDKLFKDGDVLVFHTASWGVYPIAATIGETPYTYPISNLAPKYQAMYPNGLTSNGTHWISRRIKEKLASQGINVEVYSYSYGGQTTRWAKYWLDAVLTMSPKPTHCVIHFGVNDNNSINNPSNTFYDFDPEKMFANKAESAGGINGRPASFDEWELNLKFIAEKCAAHGIKPVIMMPAHTASSAQAGSIRQNKLARLADGFS